MATTATEVCRYFELGPEAQKLLAPNVMPRPFLDTLIAQGHHADAARFMAHALPRREAIWWGCLCARHAYGPTPPPKEAASLLLSESWVSKPTDDNRRAAFQAAESAEFKNPAGLIGMAVFFSSGSLGPPGQTEIVPAPQLSPNAVGNAVVLAAVAREPGKAVEKYQQFFNLGFDVANGKNRWK